MHDRVSAPATESQPIGTGTLQQETQPVGADLKQAQDRLLELGNKLISETDPDAANLIAKALAALRSQTLRISVVGQVNAGKTTLVNALSGQPHLLPVSQSPWTAVVTRLHFGLHGFPRPCSSFQFFDDREWHRLAKQGGRLRELAERFLPGFNTAQLQQQIEAMRYHAQARLGNSFEDMLGSHHSFASINPKVVARYVSTGSTSASEAEAKEPHYADITRSADLFFDMAPFGYPLTLIDTPGTNDAFLVREEMTLRCLDTSDVCVVVIDATKGVTEADLGLFRLLRGINAQRLIVFINKVDLLKKSQEEIEKVIQTISSSIYRELGNSSPPVIAGSAEYAQSMLQKFDQFQNAATPSPAPPSTTTKHRSASSNIGNNKVHSGFEMASGLGALKDAISQLARRGQSAHYVHQASATLLTIADGTKSQAAYDLNSHKNELDVHHAEIYQQKKRQKAVEYLQDLSDQMSRTIDITISSLQHLSDAYEQRASKNLQQLVITYAAYKKEEFLKEHKGQLPAKAIHFDTNNLRQQIFVANEKGYSSARREMVNTLRVAAARLMFLMNQAQSDADVEINFNSLSSDYVYPSQSPLGRTLAIDLGEPYWKRWWRRRTTPAEVGKALEDLILQEFMPLVEDLVQLTKGELETVIENSVLQLSINGTNMVQSLKNQQLAIAPNEQQTSPAIEHGSNQKPDHQHELNHADQATAPNQLRQKIETAHSQHQRAKQLVDEFRSLTEDCHRLLVHSN